MQIPAVTRSFLLSALVGIAGVTLLALAPVHASQHTQFSGGLTEDEEELLEKILPNPQRQQEEEIKKALIEQGQRATRAMGRRLEKSKRIGKATKKYGRLAVKYGKKVGRWLGPAGKVVDSFDTGRKIGGVIYRRIVDPLMDRRYQQKAERQEEAHRREVAEIRKRGEFRRKLDGDLVRLRAEKARLDRELARLEAGELPDTEDPPEETVIEAEHQEVEPEAARLEQEKEILRQERRRLEKEKVDQKRGREYQEHQVEAERQEEASHKEYLAQLRQAQEARKANAEMWGNVAVTVVGGIARIMAVREGIDPGSIPSLSGDAGQIGIPPMLPLPSRGQPNSTTSWIPEVRSHTGVPQPGIGSGSLSGTPDPDGLQCASTPVCESFSQRAESAISHINAKHRYANAGITNSALFLALATRVGIGCTKECAKAEPTAFCRSQLGRIASELGNSYQSAINTAYSAAAERSYVSDFESYPSTSQFARNFGLQVFGGGNVDSCGE